MDLGIDGKTSVITGAGGRIGSEDCKILSNEGVEIVALDIDEEAAEETISEIEDMGGEGYVIKCDLTDRSEVVDAVAEIQERSGSIDILINNAGMVDAVGKLEEFDDNLWERDMEINLTGTYNITKQIFPVMCEQEWGRIIHMSSMAGWQGGYGQSSYSTTKAGLIGFGKTLALEGAQNGVTSNIIAPNIVFEDLAELPPEQLEEINPQFEKIRQATPMKSLGKEKDVANLIAFLCSQQANYITGQVMGVTGGIDLFSF